MYPEFKAWDKVKKKYISNFLIDPKGNVWIKELTNNGKSITFKKARNVILLRYARRLDKNKLPIYEGDIIKQRGVLDTTYNAVVKYHSGFRAAVAVIIDGKFKWVESHSIDEDCEIVGDIFHNPGLIQFPEKVWDR